MEVLSFREAEDLKCLKNVPLALSIGVFDGLHRGHLSVIETLKRIKSEIPGSKSAIITFDRNPKNSLIKPLISRRLKLKFFEELEIDYVLIIDFTHDFSIISDMEFMDALMGSFDIRSFVQGDDFRLGNPNRSSLLPFADLVKKYKMGIRVEKADEILMEGGEKLSSTLLRRLIGEGRLEEYSFLSGHRFSLDAKGASNAVKKGEVVFKVSLFEELMPKDGVYPSLIGFENMTQKRAMLSIDSENLILKIDNESLLKSLKEGTLKIESITL